MRYRNLFPIVMLLFTACTNANESPQTNVSTNTENTQPTIPISKGQTMFEQKCMSCHGGDGTAGIANAANLHTSRLDKNAIHKTIQDGRGGMPPFGSQLQADDIDSLVVYVQALRK